MRHKIRKMGGNTIRSLKKLYNLKSTLRQGDGAYVVAAWYRSRNWGDALNPFLIELISGKKAFHYKDVFHKSHEPVFSVVGSVLGSYALENLIVWGSGFISPDRNLPIRPKQIKAVRGPLTRERLLELGLECPRVFGDPALLLPRFLQPASTQTRYKLGIIPHYVDMQDPLLNGLRERPDVLIIDILSGIEQVVNDICRCAMVASSSLHGMICADAYGIPSTWIEMSDRVIGGGFKFRDYFESVGRSHGPPLTVSSQTTVAEILDRQQEYTLDIDLEALWDACPFRPVLAV